MGAHDIEQQLAPRASARSFFEQIERELAEDDDSTAEAVEAHVSGRVDELARRLLEEHFARRAQEAGAGVEVVDSEGRPLTHVRERRRVLATQFGEVELSRPSHSSREHAGVRPTDDVLELPERRYSYPLQEKAVIACLRDSYEEAAEELKRYLGVDIPKRQLEELVLEAGADVAAFYEGRVETPVAEPGSVLVVMADGKGIPMVRRDLRPATRAAAETSKLEGRRSKGEKRHRKREASVGVVFGTEPHMRTADQVIGGILGIRLADPPTAHVRPPVLDKRVWGTAEQSKEDFFYDLTAEALRHTHGEQTAVFLVDGADAYQRPGEAILMTTLRTQCSAVYQFVDLIHVTEYLWDAAWCFFAEGDREAESWMVDKMRALLEGRSSRVAASLRATASRRSLRGTKRERVDRAAQYLLNNAEYLRYDVALALGLPITTSAVEGACKNLIADRFERAGARWSLRGAEALLALRGVYRSKDWKAFWTFHVEQEQRRLREARPSYELRPKQPELRVLDGGKSSP
jgi:hypothetical protein